VRIREAALAMLGAMPRSKQAEEGAAPVRIGSVELRDVTFEHRAMKVPAFDLWVDLGEGYAPLSATFRTGDRAFEARLEPEDMGRTHVTLEARQWKMPFPAVPLVFESLHASGTLQGSRLELPQIASELYGGTLAGGMHLDWNRHWRLGGKADITGVDLLPLLKDLGRPGKLSGRLDAKVVFSSNARTAGQLGQALVLDAPAEVRGGAWHGVDLARAAELPLGKLPAGGETPFAELRADVALRGKTIRLEQICARSPTLVAGGRAEVAADQALSGKLDVSVAKTGGIVGVPLALGGEGRPAAHRPVAVHRHRGRLRARDLGHAPPTVRVGAHPRVLRVAAEADADEAPVTARRRPLRLQASVTSSRSMPIPGCLGKRPADWSPRWRTRSTIRGSMPAAGALSKAMACCSRA